MIEKSETLFLLLSFVDDLKIDLFFSMDILLINGLCQSPYLSFVQYTYILFLTLVFTHHTIMGPMSMNNENLFNVFSLFSIYLFYKSLSLALSPSMLK